MSRMMHVLHILHDDNFFNNNLSRHASGSRNFFYEYPPSNEEEINSRDHKITLQQSVCPRVSSLISICVFLKRSKCAGL